ncbi:MAG: c-type cytochrome [Chloroflexi bacterium]|nr:c-type cytochrome [Chloroflexota bacterium]
MPLHGDSRRDTIAPHGTRRWKAIFFLTVLLAGVLALNCAPPTQASSSQEQEAGERLYASQCATCHAAQGDRIPTAPLNSKDFLDGRGDATLMTAISEGKGVMPAFGQGRGGPFSDEQVRQVVAYLNIKAGRSTAALLAGAGKGIYDRNCVRCHGEKGDRVPIAPLLTKGFLDNLADDDLTKAIEEGKGVMPPVGDALKDEEIRAVVSFLRHRVDVHTTEIARRGRDLYMNNCLGCHGERGDRVRNVDLASAKYLQNLGDGKVIGAINQGKGTMPSFGQTGGGSFAVEDTAAVLAYIKAWAGLSATSALAGPAVAQGGGKDLYARNCASCHGETGDKVPGIALMSAVFLESQTGPVLFQTVARGNPKGMPAWAQSAGGPLTDAEITSILEYLRSGTRVAAAAPAAAPKAADGALAAKGKDLFAQSCSACHGQTRDKLPTAKLGDGAWLQQRGDETLINSITNGKGGMPAWGKAKGGALSEDDVKAIVAYLKQEAGG